MSNDDVTVTDRDRAAVELLFSKLSFGTPDKCRESRELAAQALAQARSEGEANLAFQKMALKISADKLNEYIEKTVHAEEALRVAVEAIKQVQFIAHGRDDNDPTPPAITTDWRRILTVTRAVLGSPTTASTKTDADECKEDLVEFLKAAWDPDAGFTNGNNFYRLLVPLYEKYCGAEDAK